MDPRVAKSHAAVMQAATDLLVEGGPDALTVDAVVARSGVAKSTVYRHWATRADLVDDVFHSCAPELQGVDAAATFDEALRQLVDELLAIMSDPQWRRLVPALMLLKSQQGGIAELDDEMKAQQNKVVGDVLRRGVAEGVLRPDVLEDVDLTITLLAGPVLMAGLVDSVPLDGVLAERVIDQFLRAHQAVETPATT
jgi:AcrR family transcriptional regulator